MSYTHSIATATCSIPENFDLNEYVKSLSILIDENFDSMCDDIQGAFLDHDPDEVEAKLNNYVRMSDGKLLIEFDTEGDDNYDSSLFDWIVNQVRQDVMESKFMQVNYSTYDTRYGVECGTTYYRKDGTYIGSDDIYEFLEKNLLN